MEASAPSVAPGVHKPVLLEEALAALAVRGGGRYVDGTLGRAGHAAAIAARGGDVLGIDRDAQALEEVARRFPGGVSGPGSLKTVKGAHGSIAAIARENGWENADGILLDLGVSSPQLDEAGRGFSFLRDGPLDMRMDRSQSLTAADVVNGFPAEDLAAVLRDFGEESRAAKIARWIAAERAKKPFETTLRLADGIEKLIGRKNGRHPATRTFQALRMAVNDETGELERALSGALEILAPGGRVAVITFESVTDRIVKRFFAAHAGRMESLPQGGAEWRGELPRVKMPAKKPVCASEEEVAENPRARSAKLRFAEKEVA